MRLINLDKLLDDINRTIEESGLVNHECEIMDCIKYADIIDTDIEAEPVRHGRWEDRTFFNGDTYDHDLFCSVCNHNYGSPEYEYCPYCGAKMNEESEVQE